MTTDLTELEQAKALENIRELLTAHWREAQDAQDEDGKSGIGFKVSFDRGASPTKLKVTCRISKTFCDEPSGARQPAPGSLKGSVGGRWQIETTIEDPQQATLEL